MKADQSPVTIADQEAETLLRKRIAETYPGEAILGEEEGGASETQSRWIIDPIDGTKSFVCGVPLYANLLSYEENGVPIVGVAYFPAIDEMVFAELGGGTWWNGKRAAVTTRSESKGAFLACGGPSSMIKYGRWDGFAELSTQAMATRTWSDAFGHILVATGRVDVMIDPVVSRWDLSAVKLIVEEAGGTFTDFRGGNPLDKGDFELEAISSNGHIHQEILKVYAQ